MSLFKLFPRGLDKEELQRIAKKKLEKRIAKDLKRDGFAELKGFGTLFYSKETNKYFLKLDADTLNGIREKTIIQGVL